MKNKNLLDNKKASKIAGGEYDPTTHSVKKIDYHDDFLNSIRDKVYASSFMHGENLSMEDQNKNLQKAIEKKVGGNVSSVKEIPIYRANHNM